MGAFVILSLALLTFGAHANPWLFQEIKPLNDAETVKKSSIPDKPVKDIDPTKPTIHIKQDIREDILGKNTSSTKFKEGVKKLLDFLEAGPKAIGDAPDKLATSPSAPGSQNPKGNETHVADANKKDNQMLKLNNESLSYKQSDFSQVNGMNSKDLNTVANGDHDDRTQKESNSNFVNQLKEPPAIPMRSEINSNGMLHDGMMDKNLQSVATGDHLSASFNKDGRTQKESNSNFVNQLKEPPAIPMRSEINSNGMSHDGMVDKDIHSVATGDHLSASFNKDGRTQKESNSNFVNQLKEPPAIPMRSEINNNGMLHDGMVDKDIQSVATGDHLSSFNKDSHDDRTQKESNSNFVNQVKEPPAIPMRSQINSNGMLPVHATVALLHNGKAGFGGNVVSRSQIPYTMPYQANQLLQNNAIVRSNYKLPNPVNLPNLQYNPYSALSQRSAFPHHYGNYVVPRPQRPISMATQAYRYPYNQRRMLPLKPNSFNPALRTNVRLPFYKGATLRSPAYNPRLRFPYTKTFVPQRPAMIPQRAPMSLFPAGRSNIPNFQNFQMPQPHNAYQVLPKWNRLGRNAILKPASRPRGLKYRRLATNDRGRSYTGLSSPRDKVTQKSPLPLPLASIMTVARIVVPARPYTLNGAFKSNVETMSSEDSEEKGARAV